MDVSVIIINYKTANYVVQAVKSLQEMSSGFDYEIIVVDNDSQDGSIETIQKANLGVKVIDAHANLGTTKAYNLGIQHSKGKYIFLLNPDTKFLNNAILYMLNYLKSNNDVAIVCGNLYNLDCKPTHSFLKKKFDLKMVKRNGSFLHIFVSKINRNKKRGQFNYGKKPIEVCYACAAAMLMSKEYSAQVGNFDESIFMYGDEPAISYKLKRAGYKTMSIPEPKIMHFEGGSFNDKSHDNFSESRFRRFINGNYAAFEIIEGAGAGLEYYKILIKNEKKLRRIFKIFNKGKYNLSIIKDKIINDEINKIVNCNSVEGE